jgi:DNA modification methylase
MGAGTVGLVAKALNRHYIGCELNPVYVQIARDRIDGPLFSQKLGADVAVQP